MKKTKTIVFIISAASLLLAVLLINACKKDKPATANPCLGKQPTSAAFHLYEHPQYTNSTSPYWVDEPTDTMYRNRFFKLMPDYVPPANEAANWTYKWVINGRNTFYGQSFIAQDTFANNLSGTFTITLIAHNANPNKNCFPTDNGIDSMTKIIHTLTPGKEGIAYGKYQGYLTDNPQDTFTVCFLQSYYAAGFPDDSTLWVNNLYRGCSTYAVETDVTGAYRCLDFTNDYAVACQSMRAFLYVDEKRNAIIKFDYLPSSGNLPFLPSKTFIGKQIYRQF